MEQHSFVDSYEAVWSGIFIGMALWALFSILIPSPPRWWGYVFFAVFIGMAFAVRPLIGALLVQS